MAAGLTGTAVSEVIEEELVEEFDATYDLKMLCPSNDRLADRIFQAGVHLLAEVGAYQLDTERVIRLSREEIMEALRQAPDTLHMGEGRDMVIVTHRGVEDPEPPLNLTGPAGQARLEENYLEMLISSAQEPYVHAIESGASLTYNGKDVVEGTLMEVKSVQRDSATDR